MTWLRFWNLKWSRTAVAARRTWVNSTMGSLVDASCPSCQKGVMNCNAHAQLMAKEVCKKCKDRQHSSIFIKPFGKRGLQCLLGFSAVPWPIAFMVVTAMRVSKAQDPKRVVLWHCAAKLCLMLSTFVLPKPARGLLSADINCTVAMLLPLYLIISCQFGWLVRRTLKLGKCPLVFVEFS